ENADDRLACYDALLPPTRPAPEAATAATPTPPPAEDSYLARRWELDETKPRGRFSLLPHRDNYFLLLTYNDNRYQPADGTEYPVDEVDREEIKYQISLKTKLWQDILGKKLDLWFAYTQQSFWQLYNWEESAPFRETNYEPELLLNFRLNQNLLGWKLRTLTLGVNHQSNGRSEPLSRSWNRLVASAGMERENFTLILKGWYRIPEGHQDDDNPDLDDYFGPGEMQTYYHWDKHRVGLLLRNNFQRHHNRSSFLFDWAWNCFPNLNKVALYVQYFNGYGENLLDYDQHTNRIGIGFMLTD
ncbi:MAG: phospholipase A, partial [Desulfuromonadaceae bacterium]